MYGDARSDCYQEKPAKRVFELAVASQGEPDGYTEALACHDGQGANQRADGNVDKDVGLTVLGGNNVDEVDRQTDDYKGIHHETCGGCVCMCVCVCVCVCA